MKRRSILSLGVATVASAATFPSAAQTSRPAQAGKQPDLSGVWLMVGGAGDCRYEDPPDQRKGEVFKDRPQSQWSDTTLPFTPAGQAMFEGRKPGKGPRLVKPVFGNDPIGEANPPGLYRALTYSRPMEIVSSPGKIVQLFAYGRIFRIIYVDGRAVPKDVADGPFWYGYSVGHWEGDTLVVVTQALDGRAWMDEWGTPISDDGRVEERWRRTDHGQLQLTITVRDPAYYTRPWTSVPVVYTLRPKSVEPNEIIFAPMDEKAFNSVIRDPAGAGKAGR